jgi:hypothetical protein
MRSWEERSMVFTCIKEIDLIGLGIWLDADGAVLFYLTCLVTLSRNFGMVVLFTKTKNVRGKEIGLWVEGQDNRWRLQFL